ncbi:thiamine pyrophosphate-dependent enzyme [Frigoriflavimonas asaccharolytica]|uniref:Thiamine pyrophosphate-dependent acetolactate synthase large subunit-like protein n=1 Tax=Frigoriflavimonas asaccharolytica TaxID=2735899 RepID=A0A8J8GB14_9FLAO|nr:thiamine pyrophosphate-dependent enzyme [Frigoriflavimonas asaccharolytica]NRS92924.1 thiamine pyrophosphate-dependent acetolactate synthase large subunit-like protein [Frigoriflavimonas asaccharolytica]
MNVSEQLLQILISTGVKNVHGVTGDALNFFVKAIENSDEVEWRAFKHEGNASFAAFGESETTGNLAVCAGTVGPGALHLINGLYNAKKERTPVIAITGQIPRALQGTNYFQEVDLKKVYDDVCEYQAIIKTPEEAPQIIQRAIKIALNNRTVCRIELPADVAEMEAENQEFVYPLMKSEAILTPSNLQIENAVELINKAKKIAILAGHGCREAREEVLALSKKLKAPITHTLKAADIFDHDAENVVGLTGLIGNPSGYQGIIQCDLLIMLATDFPYIQFLPHETDTIQVDIRPENIGNRTSVKLGIHGDVKNFVERLLPKIEEKTDSKFLDILTANFAAYRKDKLAEASPERDIEPLHPQIFARYINDHASNDAIFTIETGTSAIWAAKHISFHTQRRIIGSFNHGSMAVGLPSAMGAQFAFPNREVWCISGDGAFNMAMQDFITAVRYNLPVKILILNNSQLSFVKLEMEQVGLTPAMDALHQDNVNYADYARLCGGEGVRVEKAADIEKAIVMAKNSKKPFIIDAVVNSGELSLPPHIGMKQILGFGTSKAKEVLQVISGDKNQWENLKKELKTYFD